MNKVISFDNVKERLKKNILLPLPGVSSHQKLAPQHRFPASYYLERESDYRIASVMSIIFADEKSGEARIVLIERTGGDSVHAGQVSFPGGKIEKTDASPQYAALRETQEEVGINPEQIDVIGELSPLYIPPSKFLVHPFVGLMNKPPVFILNPSEVERVLTPSLGLFADEMKIKRSDFSSARGASVNAPYYEMDLFKIWGATAMMLSELMDIIE